MVLTYTEVGDFDFAIVLLFSVDDPDEEWYKQKLIDLKSRHNEIHTHRPLQRDSSPLDLVYMITERTEVKITHRERQILLMLAEGLSTKEMTEKLEMSAHTVETHRKKLLQKFEAKNSAELVNKASKIFWLE